VGLGFELSFVLAKQVLYAQVTPPVYFALVILEMGSLKLFAWAGLYSILLISVS
jgi:hypothetical protein